MARELILNLNKNKSTFGISKIDRKKLYGFKKRLFLDEKGKECSKANLEEETGIVFVSSDISSSYLDHKGNFVEKKELEAINDEGKKVKKEESTLGKEVNLTSTSVEDALNTLKSFFKHSKDWKDLFDFIPNNLRNKLERKSALASHFVASLELVKEGDLQLRQDNFNGNILLHPK